MPGVCQCVGVGRSPLVTYDVASYKYSQKRPLVLVNLRLCLHAPRRPGWVEPCVWLRDLFA